MKSLFLIFLLTFTQQNYSSYKELSLESRAERSITGKPVLSNDSSYFFIANEDRYNRDVLIWNTKTGERHLPDKFKQDAKVKHLAFGPDNKLIATISGFEAFLWNLETGDLVRELGRFTHRTHFIGFSSDGRYVYFGSSFDSLKVLDILEDKIVFELDFKHSTGSYANFTPDGKYLVTNTLDSKFKVHQTGTWDLVSSHDTSVFSIQDISSDGKYFIAHEYEDGKISVWDLLKAKKVKELSENYWASFYLYDLGASFVNNDSQIFISHAGRKRLDFWSVEDSKLINRINIDGTQMFTIANYCKENDAELIVYSSKIDDKISLSIIDAQNGSLLYREQGGSGKELSSDCRHLVSFGNRIKPGDYRSSLFLFSWELY